MSWQGLLTNWLRQKAQERLRAGVEAAARQRTAGPAEGVPGRSFRPSRVGILFATRQESVGLVDRLAGVVTIEASGFRADEGELEGRRVVVVVCGDGGAATANAAAAIIEGHHPQLMIAAGFAAGLAPQLALGDMVLAESVIPADGSGQPIEVQCPPLANPSARWHVGRLLTVGRDLASLKDPQATGKKFEAIAADAQSWTVAEVCRQRQVPFVAVCVVRQTSEKQARGDGAAFGASRSLARQMGAIAGAVLRRPSSLKEIWNEHERNLISTDRLAECLIEVIRRRLPGSAESSPAEMAAGSPGTVPNSTESTG